MNSSKVIEIDDVEKWAGWLKIGNACFRDVPIGAEFRFATGPHMIKTGRGYRTPDGKNFKTGALAAVFYPAPSN